MTIAQRLASWAAELSLVDVPGPVRHAAVRHLLDGFGTALAARRTAAVEPALAVASGLGGPAEATLLGGLAKVSAPAAAFANGALVHGLDFDDTHADGLVHATAVVLPAAVAVGEQVGAAGAEVLAAAVAGYETVCRIAMASPYGFHARGLHATPVAGVFAATTVAARLYRLDAARTVQALGIAGSGASGLLEFLATGASTKQLHPGSASLNGILAARLAEAGATGPDSVLEGTRGLYAALAGRPVNPAAVTHGLGETWQVTRMTIKPYPACQLMHAALDATTAAVDGARITPDHVVSVLADVHPDAVPIVCQPADRKIAPRTGYDAKFSLQWSVAALLVDGGISVDTYEPPSIARPAVADLAARVRVTLTDPAGSAAAAPGQIRVELRDGTVLHGHVTSSRGAPSAPLDDVELREKFHRNAGNGPAARELADRLLGLADETDLSAIVHLAAVSGKE